MEKKELMYEGKAKIVYKTADEDKVIVKFKDVATAFDGKKKGEIKEKGLLNTAISAIFFELLEEKGIPTHYLELIAADEMLARKVEIIPIEVVVRNIAAGSLVRRLGFPEGEVMEKPILEFYYKDDALGDPLMNEYHIFGKKLATAEELKIIKKMAFDINEVLLAYLKEKGIDLVDFKLEFGRDKEGRIYLADEISPDTCRFWDSETKEVLDKDRFRKDMGKIEDAYREILARLQA
ncbi:MAG TPA: phosphoribosylaminoimidazolesuccinocarboxamide synthase [Halanaerobiaceae bacterium]|jgi:phosphoribosylaminoimidazole-succinocarboxamide synthase|nr:phosphoribosylaminoimidazolesuccinocarboxamide synthase [Bacillota bacterium]HHU91733.1 phosphoribosylaminoimidazolesuccinocarboxamide synthase [Halanaerobiaceae bacterium]HOA40281.1 phosphoribosylaminoimidazolesuccinocarboxamide synthase [Halanaerobiales bacterium]HPZ62351.1 phosphoribosylaminoimidazolesuccinocarboxamide synthase [Halanaerobiales bacterium]HQD03173.1 phosphoribosylaminoimidazolesuccinocarboxamide synthase [Halanaerobiales bacterium]